MLFLTLTVTAVLALTVTVRVRVKRHPRKSTVSGPVKPARISLLHYTPNPATSKTAALWYDAI